MTLQTERAATGIDRGGPSKCVQLTAGRAEATSSPRSEQPDRAPPAWPLVIATLPKNSRERVRVALDEYQGHRLIDVRITAQLSESSDAWFPTKKGVSLALSHLPALAHALAEAEAVARKMGLIGGEA